MYDTTTDNILNYKVCLVIAKASYLKFYTMEEFSRILAEQQYGGIFKFSVAVYKLQRCKDFLSRSLLHTFGYSLGIYTLVQKVFNGFPVNIFKGCFFKADIIPTLT